MQSPGPDIRQVCDDVLAAVRNGEKVYVEGPVGSGRNSLIDRLRTHRDTAVLDLLPLGEVDAPATAFVEFASALHPADRPRMTRGGDDEYHALATKIRERLTDVGRLVVVRLPESWARIAERSDDDSGVAHNARAWFEGIAAVKAPVVIVADAAVNPKGLGLHQWRVLQLPEHRVPLASLESMAWGFYADAFARLQGAAPTDRVQSPLAWRLAIGVVALGGTPVRALTLLDTLPRLHTLAEELGRLAASRGALAESIRVAIAIRRPITPAALLSITAPPEEHAPLFVECIGYGVGAVRIASPVRTALSETLGDVRLPARAHSDLAAHYRTLDGATSPWTLGPAEARAWSEKVHHIARSDDGAAEWATQDLAAPEQYWERARALSLSKKYREAAALYAQCVERFPDDDYAWHYRGWNLMRARGSREEVERSYREAIRLAPENPWWNSRLVTFLIESGQPRSARDEWSNAIARIDADGDDVARSPWLALHLHRWVAKTWFDAGRASMAAAVLGSLPERHLAEDKLAGVARQITEADPTVAGEDPRWVEFLRELSARCEIAPPHADHVRGAWQWLRSLGGAELPIPMAGRTADGERLQFCWSYVRVLLEVEVDAEGSITWFALDRSRDVSGSGEGQQSADALRMWLQEVIDG